MPDEPDPRPDGEPPAESDAALREELSVFGLSDTEIDTYLALLARGEATTRRIAEDADVTQRAVYGITERLESRGLVQIKDHASPTTIRALPPREALNSLSARLESLATTLERRYNEAEAPAPEIQMVKSRETALKRLRGAIREADQEIFITIPDHVHPELEAELRDAVERDVFVLLLLSETEGDSVEDVSSAGIAAAVRHWDVELPFLYAVDDESAMIGNPDVLARTHSDKEAVFVSQKHLTGAVLGIYLSAYWPAARQLYVTDPVALPKAFDWFRQAVFHAYLHHRDGTELWVDVETRTGEELFGRVSDVRQAFVEPWTNDYTLEMSLLLETAAGEVSVGGPGSFIEDYRAETITLRTEP